MDFRLFGDKAYGPSKFGWLVVVTPYRYKATTVFLTSTDSIEQPQLLYPNYFADTQKFTSLLANLSPALQFY